MREKGQFCKGKTRTMYAKGKGSELSKQQLKQYNKRKEKKSRVWLKIVEEIIQNFVKIHG